MNEPPASRIHSLLVAAAQAAALLASVCAPCAPAAQARALASPPAAAPAVSAHQGRFDLFEAWVREQMRYRHQPGMALGVVVDGEVVWQRGFGLADLESGRAVTPQTAFRLGSISKLFTSVATLQLRDDGRLALHDPVADHLPRHPIPRPAPDEPPMTVWNLLTHTSGLPREAPLPYWTNRVFPDREQLRETLSEVRLAEPPSTRYRYSNLGMALLGEVAAVAAEEPFEELVRRRILEPLNMASTRVLYGELHPGLDLATGYLVTRDGLRPVAPATDSRGIAPAADFTSTIADLTRFLQAQLPEPGGASPLLSASTLREMHRVHWLRSWSSGRGLGFSVWKSGDRTLVGHGGWVAGFRSHLAFDPERRSGVVVLTNSDEGGPSIYSSEVFDFLIPALEAAAPAREDCPHGGHTGALPGLYANPWGEATQVACVDGRWTLFGFSYPPADDIAGGLETLEPVGSPDGDQDPTFRRDDGVEVRFELDDRGRVRRVRVGENYLFPEGCRITETLDCVR